MKGRKNLVWMLIAALLFSIIMVGVGTSSPPPWAPPSPRPLVYVDHWLNTAEPGETFDIYITARDVEDLFLAEFRMTVDYSVLEVVDDPATPDIEGIDTGDVWPYLERIYHENVMWDAATHWYEIRAVSGRPVGVHEGLSGTVGLAKITFLVKSKGKTILNFIDPNLRDTAGNYIYHRAQDGYFTNENPILWIKKKGAHGTGVWPEWHGAPVGTTNTLYATIVNTGVEAANTRVVFMITGPVEELAKTSIEQTIAADGKATFSVTHHAPDPGKYTFYAYIEYEVVPYRWVLWEDVEDVFGGEGYSYDVGTGWFKAK